MPQYCLVKHHIVSSVIDGPDLGNDPDTVPISGDVTFYPILDHGDSVVVTDGSEKVTYILSPISARIVNGKIFVNGEEGVKLFAGGPDSNPDKIRYRAKFTGLNIAGGKHIDLKDILFEAIPGGELALSVAQPVPGAPYPGYSATIEEAILKINASKEVALTEISTERESALASVGSAVQARLDSMAPMVWVFHSTGTPTLAGFPGARVGDVVRRISDGQEWRVDAGKLTPITNPVALRLDTTVGTRIFAGDTMIYGHMPWRNISHLLEPGWTGQAYVTRTATDIRFRFEALAADTDASLSILTSPIGLRPLAYLVTPRWELPSATTPAQYYRGQFSATGSMTMLSRPPGPLYGDISFPTGPQWPSVLP